LITNIELGQACRRSSNDLVVSVIAQREVERSLAMVQTESGLLIGRDQNGDRTQLVGVDSIDGHSVDLLIDRQDLKILNQGGGHAAPLTLQAQEHVDLVPGQDEASPTPEAGLGVRIVKARIPLGTSAAMPDLIPLGASLASSTASFFKSGTKVARSTASAILVSMPRRSITMGYRGS
jgi:hypothetical protein